MLSELVDRIRNNEKVICIHKQGPALVRGGSMGAWTPTERVPGNCPDKVATLVSSKKISKSEYLK